MSKAVFNLFAIEGYSHKQIKRNAKYQKKLKIATEFCKTKLQQMVNTYVLPPPYVKKWKKNDIFDQFKKCRRKIGTAFASTQ
jgi:hypothetical protein